MPWIGHAIDIKYKHVASTPSRLNLLTFEGELKLA